MAVGTLRLEASSGLPAAPLGTVRWRVLAVGLAVSLATAVTTVEVRNAQAADSAGYSAVAAQADRSLAEAERAGYSRQDLAPLARAVDAGTPGAWALPWQHGHSFRESAATLAARLAALPSLEVAALDRHRAGASARIAGVATALDAAALQGADAADLDGIRSELAGLVAALPEAADPHAVDTISRATGALESRARSAGSAAAAEQARLLPAADALRSQFQGNLDQLRAAGAAAVGPARDDATVAALLKISSAKHLSGRLEHYAEMIGTSDAGAVALGVAGAQSYQRQVHEALIGNLPHKAIVVSLAAQHLLAYQDGKVMQDTLVTTGRPELPTDVGAMKVLSKDTPWKMHSPWPKGSPHWYPDTTVRKVVWFTVTGEGLHDAAWQPVSTYGPGGQFTESASHGCVHVPDASEDFLYGFADIGTPVIVFPGDGTPVSSQLKQVSVDANGVPLTGPKGS